ncbi:MAG: hypothetical protein US50_C0064G0005 [Candidatus Nomurabacteria bacterium GW2011_GWB1_37_5]|uniref:Uncharacterized protein n=1 Tax=Candidatus Nomurabacteria bacterium GW2011_GWB1_37_5 TaxID=1618742 RepID=A0A0G0GSH9_9BACT|nr:MAG: hypothetical protein US50_C0064G0005 [Candidatus Nomurabacteria bacterium GW2011_GWB1_37_5]
MESSVGYKHLDDNLAKTIEPVSGDDALTASWTPVDQNLIENMHANHGLIILKSLHNLYSRNLADLDSDEKGRIMSLFKNFLNKK